MVRRQSTTHSGKKQRYPPLSSLAVLIAISVRQRMLKRIPNLLPWRRGTDTCCVTMVATTKNGSFRHENASNYIIIFRHSLTLVLCKDNQSAAVFCEQTKTHVTVLIAASRETRDTGQQAKIYIDVQTLFRPQNQQPTTGKLVTTCRTIIIGRRLLLDDYTPTKKRVDDAIHHRKIDQQNAQVRAVVLFKESDTSSSEL